MDRVPLRSFGGCDTCRLRRVKCDESRPGCLSCVAAGFACGGYGRHLFFSSSSVDDGACSRYRRHLFTDAERERMAQWITSRVPPKAALRCIAQMDEDCEDAPASQSIDIHRGPFGVFRASEGGQHPAKGHLSPSWDHAWSDDLTAISPELFGADPAAQGRAQAEARSDGLQDQLDPFADVSPVLLPLSTSAGAAPRQESADNELRTELAGHGLRGHSDIGVFSCTRSDMIEPPRADASLTLPVPTLADNLVLSDALSLLKHYSNHIIALLTPYQHTKTPWHVLFVPHAKSCLADLAIGETPDRARLTAFFGTLAISALSLSGGARAGHGVWSQRARSHHDRARDHCRSMIVGAYDIPKTAKYKSILMALQTMIQLSALLGELDDVEFYFLEAEKLIRLKGLHRRKSRKVRLLHHCYVYQRMLYESTCASRVDSSHRRLVLEAVGSSGVVACGQDTPHFRAPSWRNLQAEMLREKTQDEGENDLLLEQPGKWPGTLYPEIFGIPEILVFFLSHVIRLGYEKDGADVDDVPSPGALQDFFDRAKALERCINQLIPPPLHGTAMMPTHRSGPPVGDVLQCMVAAIANGLSIFFYRRIYDADASILQQRVFAVRDCLAKCERDGSGSRQGSLGLVWPAFIAAREAEDINLQAFFAMWFRTRAAESGLDIFMLALKIAEASWEAKKLSNGINVCWIDLINSEQSVLG